MATEADRPAYDRAAVLGIVRSYRGVIQIESAPRITRPASA